MAERACRFCARPLAAVFCDLGATPLANRFLRREQLAEPEPRFPLCAYVCESCWLVQLPAHEKPEAIFSDYAYFSSYSASWLAHAEAYAAAMTARLGLGARSLVVEAASNDGYLLQYFAARGVPVLGVEPAANVAAVAREKGIRTEALFLGAATGRRLAAAHGAADLVAANNVFAHVPDIRDFAAGLRELLKPDGVVTLEFPHLLELIRHNQFDTIYHEHYSYLALGSASRVLESQDLRVFDVETLPTHGGSLRLFACRAASTRHARTARVDALLAAERAAGLERAATYRDFGERVAAVRRDLRRLLADAADRGQPIVGYGAPAKGNTLLNYCGITPRELPYTVDASPHKQGLFLPGTRIPVLAPAEIDRTRPAGVLILPWNLRDEIAGQLRHTREWGCRAYVPIPAVALVN